MYEYDHVGYLEIFVRDFITAILKFALLDVVPGTLKLSGEELTKVADAPGVKVDMKV